MSCSLLLRRMFCRSPVRFPVKTRPIKTFHFFHSIPLFWWTPDIIVFPHSQNPMLFPAFHAVCSFYLRFQKSKYNHRRLWFTETTKVTHALQNPWRLCPSIAFKATLVNHLKKNNLNPIPWILESNIEPVHISVAELRQGKIVGFLFCQKTTSFVLYLPRWVTIHRLYYDQSVTVAFPYTATVLDIHDI